MTDTQQQAVRTAQLSRWWVHLGLIVTVTVSLWFEPMLTTHIVVGLAFIGLCVAHVGQRRRVTLNLVSRLVHPATLHRAQVVSLWRTPCWSRSPSSCSSRACGTGSPVNRRGSDGMR